jgi:hypothetical protein
MWGYRQLRGSGYGMNLSKMLNCLVFFLLMALVSSAGIPTMLMSNRQAMNQAKVTRTNTQFAHSKTIKKSYTIQTVDFKSTIKTFNNHGKRTVVVSNIQTVAYRP